MKHLNYKLQLLFISVSFCEASAMALCSLRAHLILRLTGGDNLAAVLFWLVVAGGVLLVGSVTLREE